MMRHSTKPSLFLPTTLSDKTIFVTNTVPGARRASFELVRHINGKYEQYIADNVDEVLTCAIASGAEYLVTNDRDLRSFKKHPHLTVLTPEAYVRFAKDAFAG